MPRAAQESNFVGSLSCRDAYPRTYVRGYWKINLAQLAKYDLINRLMLSLLHRNRFGEVAGFIDVATAFEGDVVAE